MIEAKLQLITHAYFEEKDFSQISILKARSFTHNTFSDILRTNTAIICKGPVSSNVLHL